MILLCAVKQLGFTRRASAFEKRKSLKAKVKSHPKHVSITSSSCRKHRPQLAALGFPADTQGRFQGVARSGVHASSEGRQDGCHGEENLSEDSLSAVRVYLWEFLLSLAKFRGKKKKKDVMFCAPERRRPHFLTLFRALRRELVMEMSNTYGLTKPRRMRSHLTG